jgi:hypothetical protein
MEAWKKAFLMKSTIELGDDEGENDFVQILLDIDPN